MDLFSQEQESETERTLEIITDKAKAKELAAHLEDLVTKDGFEFYVLADGSSQQEYMPVGVAFGTTDGKTSYVPIDNDVLLAQRSYSRYF